MLSQFEQRMENDAHDAQRRDFRRRPDIPRDALASRRRLDSRGRDRHCADRRTARSPGRDGPRHNQPSPHRRARRARAAPHRRHPRPDAARALADRKRDLRRDADAAAAAHRQRARQHVPGRTRRRAVRARLASRGGRRWRHGDGADPLAWRVARRLGASGVRHVAALGAARGPPGHGHAAPGRSAGDAVAAARGADRRRQPHRRRRAAGRQERTVRRGRSAPRAQRERRPLEGAAPPAIRRRDRERDGSHGARDAGRDRVARHAVRGAGRVQDRARAPGRGALRKHRRGDGTAGPHGPRACG